MTPAEKWHRLTHPQTVEDYGLGMSLEEIKQVPEAMVEVLCYLPPQHQDIFNEEKR